MTKLRAKLLVVGMTDCVLRTSASRIAFTGGDLDGFFSITIFGVGMAYIALVCWENRGLCCTLGGLVVMD